MMHAARVLPDVKPEGLGFVIDSRPHSIGTVQGFTGERLAGA